MGRLGWQPIVQPAKRHGWRAHTQRRRHPPAEFIQLTEHDSASRSIPASSSARCLPCAWPAGRLRHSLCRLSAAAPAACCASSMPCQNACHSSHPSTRRARLSAPMRCCLALRTWQTRGRSGGGWRERRAAAAAVRPASLRQGARAQWVGRCGQGAASPVALAYSARLLSLSFACHRRRRRSSPAVQRGRRRSARQTAGRAAPARRRATSSQDKKKKKVVAEAVGRSGRRCRRRRRWPRGAASRSHSRPCWQASWRAARVSRRLHLPRQPPPPPRRQPVAAAVGSQAPQPSAMKKKGGWAVVGRVDCCGGRTAAPDALHSRWLTPAASPPSPVLCHLQPLRDARARQGCIAAVRHASEQEVAPPPPQPGEKQRRVVPKGIKAALTALSPLFLQQEEEFGHVRWMRLAVLRGRGQGMQLRWHRVALRQGWHACPACLPTNHPPAHPGAECGACAFWTPWVSWSPGPRARRCAHT